MNKEIKISNELLSSVFGCECEFYKIEHCIIIFSSDNNEQKFIEKMVCEYGAFMDDEGFWHFNLDTFIRITKKKLFDDYGTIIRESSGFVRVIDLGAHYEFISKSEYSQETMLIVLETCLKLRKEVVSYKPKDVQISIGGKVVHFDVSETCDSVEMFGLSIKKAGMTMKHNLPLIAESQKKLYTRNSKTLKPICNPASRKFNRNKWS